MGKIKNKLQKQTTKLRIGRRLPKGDNVTNTTFKTKKIVIPDQAKPCVGDSEIKQELHIFNLIKRVNNISHHDFLKLQNFLDQAGDTFLPHLNGIFNKLIEMIVSTNAQVRKRSLNLMKIVLCKMSAAGLRLYCPSLDSHINCAVTHIDTNVCYDSFKFLKLILDIFPESLCMSYSLIQNLFKLLSSENARSDGAGSSHLSVSIILSPDDKISTLAFRRSVLKCVLQFLKANIPSSKPEKPNNILNDIPLWKRNNNFTVVRHFTFEPKAVHSAEWDWAEVCHASHAKSGSDFDLKVFLNDIGIALIHTWIEVAPSSTASSVAGIALNSESVEIMIIILQCVCSLTEWGKRRANETQLKNFSLISKTTVKKHVLRFFPYPRNSASNCVNDLISDLNLALCELVCMMLHELSSWKEKVLQVLFEEIESMECEKKGGKTLIIIRLLKSFLLSVKDAVYLCQPHLTSLLKYAQTCSDSQNKDMIWDIFRDLALDKNNFDTVYDNVTLNLWLKLYLMEFIQNSTSSVAQVDRRFCIDICKIAGSCYPVFMETLTANAESVISLLMSPNEAVRGTACELIFTFERISPELFSDIATVIRQGNVPSECVKHLLEGFTDKKNDSIYSIENYLSFLLSVTIRPHADDENHSAPQDILGDEVCIPYELSPHSIVQSAECFESKELVEVCIHQLCRLDNTKELSTFIQQFLILFLQQSRKVPVCSAVSLLKLCCTFLSGECVTELPKELLLLLGSFIVAYCLYEFAMHETNEELPSLSIYDVLLQCPVISIGHIFKVMNMNASVLNIENYSYCIKQLVNELLDTSLKTEDVASIATFIRRLCEIFGEDFSEEHWWQQLRALRSA